MSARRGSRARALALALLTFGISHARAAELDIPPECGNREAFDAELRRRLGDAVSLDRVQVSIVKGSTSSRLRVQIGNERRELTDPSCTELFRASVVVALAILLPDEKADQPTTPQSISPPPRTSRALPRFSLGLGGGLRFGTLPRPVFEAELEAKALWRHFGGGLSLHYLAPSEKLTADDKGVELGALGAAVTGIFKPSRSWETRLGFSAERLSGQGTGSIARRSEDSAWAAGPTLGLAYLPIDLPPFWAGIAAEGRLNVARGQFQILNYSRYVADEPYVVYRVPWLAGRTLVSLGLDW